MLSWLAPQFELVGVNLPANSAAAGNVKRRGQPYDRFLVPDRKALYLVLNVVEIGSPGRCDPSI
jgi:hypothetical protein